MARPRPEGGGIGPGTPSAEARLPHSSAVSVESAEPCEEDAPEEKELRAVSTASASSGSRWGVHSGSVLRAAGRAGSSDTDTVRALESSSPPLPMPEIVRADVLRGRKTRA